MLNPVENVVALGTAAVMIEGIVDFYRDANWVKIATALVGITFAVVFNLDVLKAVGLTTDYNVLSLILSGVILGRGSNYVNDTLQRAGIKLKS